MGGGLELLRLLLERQSHNEISAPNGGQQKGAVSRAFLLSWIPTYAIAQAAVSAVAWEGLSP